MADNLQILKQMVASVVVGEEPNGTAFLVDELHAVTALHVLDRNRKVKLKFLEWRPFDDDGVREAKLDWSHPAGLDLAVLKLDREIPPQVAVLPWGSLPKAGADWYTFGFPGGVDGGHASIKNNYIEDPEKKASDIDTDILQLSSDIAAQEMGGFSGSPCVVGKEIVGVLTSQLSRDGKPLFNTLYGLPIGLLKPSGRKSPSAGLLPLDHSAEVSGIDWRTYRQQLRLTNLKTNRGQYIADDDRFTEPLDIMSRENLLALHGSFGRGKTRMAEELAWRAEVQYPDGIWVVEIENIAAAEGILPAIATAMDLETSGAIKIKDIVNHIGRGEVLLILDGCERFVDECMGIGIELSNNCSGLKVLLTAQDKARDCYNIDVPLLKVPPKKDAPEIASVVEKYEAVRFLLYQSSRAGLRLKLTNENAGEIAELCRLVRGVPLELMLVAGGLLSTDVEGLISKLRNREEELQALDLNSGKEAAALEKTLEICSAELDEYQSNLLTRLAVFRGPFTEEAARAVVGETYRSGDMNTVVDRSFVDRVRDRNNRLYYLILRATRQFYWRKTIADGLDMELRHSHLAHYLDVVKRLNHELKGGEQVESLNQLEKEHDNILSAIEFAMGFNRVKEGAVLASEMRRFWFLKGYYATGRKMLELALSKLPGDEQRMRAQLLADAGILARVQSDYEQSLLYLEDAREIADRDGFQDVRGTALNAIGILHWRRKDWKPAKSAFEQALAIGNTIGDMNLQAWAYNGLTNVAMGLEETARAKKYASKSFELKQKLGDKRGMAMSQDKMGQLELDSGNLPMAKKLFESALQTRRELGYRSGIAETLTQLAKIAIEEKSYPHARDYLLEALKGFMALQDRSRLAAVLEEIKRFAYLTGDETRSEGIASARHAILTEIGVDDASYVPSASELMLGQSVAWQDTVIETMGWLEGGNSA
ncbi:MAG: tetratricopeptide repeat protein [Gammaproteobacteria bacterium]|nr:tetratricopeptide repeat protein [Gammaproteobacteria bacterium]